LNQLMASLLSSVHTKLAPLGDQALVRPAHGSGSACGGNISTRDDTTVGIEKATNPVFTKRRTRFIDLTAGEKLPRPPYVSHMAQVNLGGGRTLPSPRPPPRRDRETRHGRALVWASQLRRYGERRSARNPHQALAAPACICCD
jgi:hypothetical protein